MRNIFTLFIFLSYFYANAQSIDSAFATKINCNQPIGYIDVFCAYCDTTPNISYEWYDTVGTGLFVNILSTNQDYNDTLCGVYTLIVSENNIPFDTVSRFIGCPLTIGLAGTDSIPCIGGVGTIKRSSFGGDKFDPNNSINSLGIEDGDEYYVYRWFSADDTLGTNSVQLSDTTASLIAVTAGFYKVEVWDASGCRDTLDAINYKEFRDPDPITLQNIILDSISCHGDITTLELQVKGGRRIVNTALGYDFYIIQNNDTIAFSDSSGQSNNFNVLGTSAVSWQADTVSINLYANSDSVLIRIIDGSSCIIDSIIFIPQPDSIVATITHPNSLLICSYDSALIFLDTDSIVGGSAPYSHYWNNDITQTQDSVFVNGGFHKVYIVDANSCLDSTNGVNISSHQDFTMIDSIVNVDCFGKSTGEIQLEIFGGTRPFLYTWEKDGAPFLGGPSDTIKSNLSAGNHKLIIEDLNQCVDTSTFIISENSQILLNPSLTPSKCSQPNGSIQLNVNGGMSPYSYNWNTGSVSDSISGLQGGNYVIEVLDSLGCSVLDSFQIPSVPPISISFTNYTSSLSCYGELTAITANISGGTTSSGNYTISWDNSDTTNQTILGGGTHQIHVSDEDGCEDSATVLIESPDPLTLDTNATNPSCLGNDGIIDLIITGGTLPYQIQWSTGGNSTSIAALTAGTYWVVVVDSCGIKDSLSVELSPYISTLNIDNFNLTQPSCSDDDGTIDITVSGGFTPYTYNWSNGQTNEDLSGVGYGSYTVLITDDCGLTTTATYTLNQMTSTVSANGFYDYLSLWSAVSVNGVYPPFTINWTMPDTIITGDSVQGLCEGNYPITVTDSKNCKDTLSINVLYNINQLVDATTSTVIDTSWGIGPFSYKWSDGQTTPTADSLCEGYHSVIVTANGGVFACSYTEGFTIDPLSVILNPDVSIVDCEDDFDGTIIVNPSGGTPNYRFLWSTGDTLDRLDDNLNPGTYYVSFYDRNGCQLDTSIQIAAIGADCIPNVFSPNGDNINDNWELEDSFLYQESSIIIYGRFGKKMYESVGYDIPWDGTNKKGNAVPDGAYFYVITLKGSIDPIRGTVTIIR